MNYFKHFHNLLQYKKSMILALVLTVMYQPLFSQDNDISIYPTSAYFEEVAPGSVSDTVSFTVTNHHSSDSITLGAYLFQRGPGANGHEFNIFLNTCPDATLTPSASCTFQVRFEPTSEGTKHVFVNFPYTKSSGGSGELMAYLSSKENVEHEALRRLPPVITELSIPEEMNASAGNPNTYISSYDLNWSVVGYNKGYRTNMVMFDCTGVTVPNCGADYNDLIYESGFLTPYQIQSANVNVSYSGISAKKFYFTHNYTVPEKNVNKSWPVTGTEFVIRFYVISDEDLIKDVDENSTSLIIPGNLSENYYDTSGRKIQKIICPSAYDGGCQP